MSCIRFLAVTFVSFAFSAAAFGQDLNLPKAESAISGRGHLRLDCTTCHSVHKAKGGKVLFIIEPNKKVINPATNKPFEGVSSLCLACHAPVEEGGAGMVPVSASHSHPMGRDCSTKTKVANVKEEFLRDGKLECVGCHDPHTSNPNWGLLRVDTKKGTDMDTFCAMCHPSKADPSNLEAIKKMRIFTSMDETKPPAAPAAAAAAPAKPAAPVATPEKTPAK